MTTPSSSVKGHNLTGWGTHSAQEYDLTPEQLLTIVQQLQSNVNTAEMDSLQKKGVFKLSKVLTDAEIATRFRECNGLQSLVNIVGRSKGNTLTYGIAALRSFAIHDFGVELLSSNFTFQAYLFELLNTEIDSGNISIVKQVLGLVAEIAARAPSAYHFLQSYDQNELIQKQAQNTKKKVRNMYELISACITHNSVDLQQGGIKLINALLLSSRDAKQYQQIMENLTNLQTFRDGILALVNQ